MAIDRMLMHLTPGRESQARTRAVVAGDVVEPDAVVAVTDREVVAPSGGSVTLEVASSPPHALTASANAVNRQMSDSRRTGRGEADAVELFTAPNYCVTGLDTWSSGAEPIGRLSRALS
jgi:hypothetical protein